MKTYNPHASVKINDLASSYEDEVLVCLKLGKRAHFSVVRAIQGVLRAKWCVL